MRRLWAAIGAIIIGLIVTGFYSFLSKQPLPDLQIATHTLSDRWPWLGGALVVLAIVSTVAERNYRRREEVPRPAHPTTYQRFKQRWRLRRGAVLPALTTGSFPIVGRGAELARLNDWFAQAGAGQRRVIFVSGEPGIGKTTLTRSFLDSIAIVRNTRIGRGQCVEQYGAGEPYMPILEALTRLCREPGGKKLVEILYRMAPAWLAQMPSLISAEDRARLQGVAQGTTQQRMLREMAEALEVIAAETPMVLFLEDLHWSDPSTLDLIATVARRTEPARLMILGTYRPVEMLAGEHPLRAMKEELELHQQAIELRLPLLSQANVTTYLHERFTPNDSRPSPLPSPIRERDPEKIASAIYARSEGNPLFMVNVVDYLIEQGSLADADKIEAPRTIRQMIERNLQRLSPDEQRILEAASVAGAEFSAAAVAAGLERPIHEIEACCTGLARREQFIGAQGTTTWPDGTTAASLRFRHALYRETLYDRVPAGHRVELHARIAERAERAYGKRAAEIAAELADHYWRANQPDKAVEYFRIAAERAVERRAYRESEQHYREAIKLLQTLPESAERDAREIKLQAAFGRVMQWTRGWSAAETVEAYTKARLVAERSGGTASLQIIAGLWSGTNLRGEPRTALALADQMLAIARDVGEPAALATAFSAEGYTRYLLGDLAEARRYLLNANEQYRSADSKNPRLSGDPLVFSALTEWHLGYPDRALRYMEDALLRARRVDDPAAIGWALWFSGNIYGYRRDFVSTRACCEEAQKIGFQSGFALLCAVTRIMDSWARTQMKDSDGSVQKIREGLAELDKMQFHSGRPKYLGYLCETQLAAEAIEDAFATSDIALHTPFQEVIHNPSLHQLRGEAQRQRSQLEAAEQDFREAIDLSRKMSAKSPELRATTSLARLLASKGRRDEARTMLAEIYGWFTEGFDTRDLKEAKALLEELS